MDSRRDGNRPNYRGDNRAANPRNDRNSRNENPRNDRNARTENPAKAQWTTTKEVEAEMEVDECLIEGRNAVTEAIKAGRTINKVFLVEGSTDHGLNRLGAQAKEAGAVVVNVDRRKLDQISVTGAHQGIIAMSAAHEYATIDDIFARAERKGENPLIILCDELEDPHNLGAILRTGECAGAHGVVIPKRRAVGLTAVVAKSSAGAIEYMPVARVANMTATIKLLKDRGVWIFGTAADGSTDLHDVDFKGPTAIVIGSEGGGMGRLVGETCDFKVSIPMRGEISSLNASAAAAVLLYEAVRQRQ